MIPAESSHPRYRFAEFVLSPSRRVLLRRGTEVPLIPRYFDLLVLLVSRRNEAIHRREILDVVWSDPGSRVTLYRRRPRAAPESSP